MSQEGDIRTIDEVATYLRLGRRTVYRLAQSGEIPGKKILNRWRFHIKDVEAWVRSTGTDQGPAAAAQGANDSGTEDTGT